MEGAYGDHVVLAESGVTYSKLGTMSSQTLITSEDGASTAALGNLSRYWILPYSLKNKNKMLYV